jgi:hypothetical protein
MNFSALLRHLLLKDVQHQRLILMLVWGYALLVPWTPELYEFHNGNQYQVYYLLPLYAVILIGMIRLLQLDPPGRSVHFLITRPVRPSALLASKALFIVLFFFTPLLLSKLETVHILQISFNFLDAIFFTIETLIFSGAFFAVVALPALFLRKMTSALFFLIFGTVAFGVLTILYDQPRSRFSGTYYHPDPQLGACQWLMFELGLGMTLLAVAFVRYRWKSPVGPVGLLGGGLLLSYILLFHWPVRLDEFVSGQMFATVPSPLRDKLHFVLGSHSTNQVTWKDSTQIRSIALDASVYGLAAPYFAVQIGFHAEAPEAGLSSSYDYGVAHADGNRLPLLPRGPSESSFQEQIAGFKPDAPLSWDLYSFDIFDYILGPTSEDINWYGKTIKGALTLEIRRMFIAQTVPVRPKVNIDLPRRHYEIELPRMDAQRGTYPQQGEPRVTVWMTAKSIPLVLRGDYAESALSWLVVNHYRNEYLIPNYRGLDDFPRSPVFYNHEKFLCSLLRPGQSDNDRPPKELIPHDWLDAAEIDIFDSEPCGRINFPYEWKGP